MEVGPQATGLEVYSLTLLPVSSLLPDPGRCEESQLRALEITELPTAYSS